MSIQKISSLAPYYKIDRYWIPNTDDAYFIATNGVAYSMWVKYGWKQWISRDINDCHSLTPALGNHGYLFVRIKINGKFENRLIHRLVCEAVYGPCPPGLEACHVYDPNPFNNWSWNLRWDTRSNNHLMKRDHGSDMRGEKFYDAKLSWEIVGQLREDWKSGNYTQRQLGEKYGITQEHAGRIIRNDCWVI